MQQAGELRVSGRGQMSLPAAARNRWGLEEGGQVGYLDLGDALLVIPGGVEALRGDLLAAITEAQSKAHGQYEEEMRKATGGLPIQLPGLF